MNYFDAGEAAYNDGRDLNDNDYTPGSLPWIEWRCGWIVAALRRTLSK